MLETTRAGAVDVQESELRRIERDLHDGAQARLVALTDRSAVPVRVDGGRRPHGHVCGTRPPVLADRGLEAALETAAYFVAAEAIANAGKHAAATTIDVRIVRMPQTLLVEVTDDGRGGADAAGPGLQGLRKRVEALDGTFELASPSGGGTTLRVELPCAS